MTESRDPIDAADYPMVGRAMSVRDESPAAVIAWGTDFRPSGTTTFAAVLSFDNGPDVRQRRNLPQGSHPRRVPRLSPEPRRTTPAARTLLR